MLEAQGCSQRGWRKRTWEQGEVGRVPELQLGPVSHSWLLLLESLCQA